MPSNQRPLFLYLCIALVTSSVAQQHRKHSFRRHLPPPAHLRVLDPSSADDSELLDGEESQGGGGGKKTQQKKHTANSDDEDKPKTLSQQVADGKYGLIQNELFRKPPKRPGVISYDDNPEVPNDTAANFGGLNENEIWLAENHLLVLRGGRYPPHDTKKPPDEESGLLMWPPIDDFKAPLHQVKIPKNPKVPPPFPVPFQIFTGTQNAQNQTESSGATQEASKAANPDPSHPVAGQAAVPISEPGGPGEEWRGLPLPPSVNTQTQLNGTWPPPFLEYLPPGAVILPPPDNNTEQIDEEDPSIYYPPPYTFYYHKDNSSKVPPGPLVPGIVLPPPPDFFAPLEEDIVNNTISTPTKLTTKKPQRSRKPITTQHLNTQINPTTTPLPPTSKKAAKLYPVVKTTTTTTSAPKVITILPVRQDRIYLPHKKRPQDVTVLRPVQPPTTKPPQRGVYVYENEIPNKPYVQYATPTKKKTYSTTQGPDEYYTTQRTVEVTPRGPQEIPNNHYIQYASPDNLKTIVTTTKVPAKYYGTSISQDGPYVQYTSKKTTTTVPPRYHTIVTSEEVTNNPYVQYVNPGSKNKQIVTTTQVPLKYYTTSNNLEVNSGGNHKVKNASKPKVVPAEYFYYEEQEKNRPSTTQKPQYYQQTTEGYYNKPSQRPRRPQYIYVSAKPYNTQKPRFRPVKSRDSFSVHIAKLQKQINQYLPTSRPSPKPVYQYSFEANGYKSTKGNFRPSPSELNEDHFRPVPKYSVEIQQAIEIIPSTEAPKYQSSVAPPTKYNEYQVVPSTEAPPAKYEQYQAVHNSEASPGKYQQYQVVSNSEIPPHVEYEVVPSTEGPEVKYQQYQIVPSTESQVYQIVPVTKPPPVNYHEFEIVKSTEIPFYEQSTERPGYYGRYQNPTQKAKNLVKAVPTSRPISQYSFEATPNPLYHGFYTKPDQQEYFDENTKHYFTMFGKKLPGSTTPIPPREGNRGQSYTQQKANKPHSLEGDTAVNYLHPKPTLEPAAEVIRHYPKVSRYPSRDQKSNENPEIVKAIPIEVPSDDVEGSFISYRLPGDNGAHFYFLTPQLAERTQQGTGFYFTRGDNQRRRRNDTKDDKNG
ncbi:unnamed protein product [Callosobruchus maculatus]|uniref:DUF4794 domain-containing protein n=1 Tax=Callosobruchus maculatus TaxID=64391 RepID=A0A653D3V8_CALMS|nr:unnamed protein product [Callosobruchus maculatus]